MPKSDILPLRRWPCWPGPYSRLLTGLLGRPKTFSPMRRSSLYLALLRLLMFGPICLRFQGPGTAPPEAKSDAATASPGCEANCEAPHMAAQARSVKDLDGPKPS